MDEGDDYVPQMSQLGDYGAMSGGMGPGQAPPPVYPAMSGGLTPMNNPYEQQMMMMGQPQKPSAAVSKSRSKKKDLDPMQSMAAMSNNPMMRPSMQQMSNMYPPQPNQMGMYTPGPPQQSPHYPQSAGYRPGPPQYSTQQGYPMQQPMYPQQRPTGYPPQQPGQPGPYGYPGPQPGYPQPQYPPQMRPQYPQGQQQAPPQSQYWDQQYYQQNPPAAAGIHPQQLPPPQSDQWAQQTSQQVYQIEMEIRSLQQRLQQLYQQQRTPMLEQEMQQLQHRMQYMQAEHQRLQMQGQSSAGGQPLSGQGLTTMPATPSQHPSQIPSSLAHPQAGQPQAQPQQVVIQHQNPATPATPVQVTQSGSQVQVNIKPETSGRTLISVYHRFGESPNGEEVFNEQKDSVPPEPTPTLHHQYQIQAPSTSSHSVHQHHHQQQPSSANGIENGYQSNQILHTHTLSEQKSTVFNTYSSLQGDTNASNVTEGREQKVNVKSQIVEGSPVNTKDTNNLLQSEQAVFDDRDDATPPMRTDTVVVPTEMMSVIPSTDATFTTSAQSDYSIMSDETQPAVEEDEEEKTNEERIEGENTEESTETTTNGDVGEDEESETKEEGAEEEMSVDATDEPTPGPSSRDPSPDDAELLEIESTSTQAIGKKKSVLLKEEEKEPSPSEIADSTDGIFTEPSTPAPESRRARRPVILKARKKKSVDDSGDDDDDFIPEMRSRKIKRTIAKASCGDDGDERRNSSSKWDMGEPTLDDDGAEDSILTTDSQETQATGDQQVVEKILNCRDNIDSGEQQFLIKWKGKAYIHCEWKTLKELEDIDKRVISKVKRFRQKRSQIFGDLEDEDFNNDYTIVDRVIDVATGEDGLEYALIKWKSLAYDEVTWELISTVPADKVETWRKRQRIDKAKIKEKSRPKASEWNKLSEDMVWKDGNTLREYQFEGVDWLLYCYYNQQNCILADEMGLGKTVQTITFLSQVYDYGIHGPYLIVVPLSTIHNWVREFETWTDMNAVVYHGSQHSRDIIQQYEIFYAKHNSEGSKSWRKNLVKLDALITTFEMVVTDCEFLKKIPYRVCVIDEAHRLKNRNCKLLTGGLHAFKMEHRVLLTGTPLQNNIEELFSLLNFLHPQQFSSSAAFLEQFGQCQSDDQVQKLQEILKPMMLRRLKEDVEKSLQPKEETIIEVQLSDTQKKYYRAILERNFSHLCKGTSAPSLMNVMMELRKCCNHPFLIQGAEETILSELKLLHPEWDDETLAHKALVQASGKVVLIEKLLPKLRKDGHKVLIFSQMVKVLDLLEEFLMNMNYPFERIDGNVRGDLRQASIDRFSKKDSDRFVFLLCTRAGGLGINLTAADTVIIFDSDWNPQNDLQAQARCHRIGQTKMVKVYRLVTANTYEREMFDKASLKLGLDKAVLQSTTALKESSTALSKKDVEELLKKGAYGSIMDENVEEGSKFSEEDIETILQRRTTTITLEAGQKGSLFAKATFNSTHNRGDDIDIDDPNFWTKWAEKAQVDIEKATATPDGRELIIQEPRKRTKRFEENSLKEGEDSDGSDELGKGRKRGGQVATSQNAGRKRRRGDDEDGDYVNYRPDELAFNKSEYFKVEKVLASWGWGRWAEMKKSGELEVSEMDIAHMARTLLLHCVREYRGDERVKQTIWQLISPQGAKNAKENKGSQSVYHQGWAALPEFNPPSFALDASFQRHVHRHANKLLLKIDQLRHLQKNIIGNKSADIENGIEWATIEIATPTLAEPLCDGWDTDCDKCLLIGVFKHGLDNYDPMRVDETLCFVSKSIETFPGPSELSTRFRRLVSVSQRSVNDPVYEKLRWSRREEQEYMRVLKAFGMRDRTNDASSIDWDIFRAFSPLLEKKSDEEMQEHLYCILAMCTKAQGGELSALDTKRALSVDALSSRKAQKLMNRLHLTRKVHALACAGLDKLTPMLKLCSAEAMPSGWTTQHDKELIAVCDQHGIDNISANILQKPAFQKIIRPTEKTLLRRVIEVCTTVETGKWNGTASTDSVEDSDADEKIRQQQQVRRGRKRAADTDSQKMRALMQQTMLSQMSDLPLAAAMLQSAMFMPQLMGNNAAAAQLLTSLFAMAGASGSGTNARNSSTGGSGSAASGQGATSTTILPSSACASNSESDILNLTKKVEVTTSQSPVASSSTQQSQLAQSGTLSQLGLNELLILASLPPDTRIPVQNSLTKERLFGETAPKLKNLSAWLCNHPTYTLDLASLGKESSMPSVSAASTIDSTPSSAKPSAPPTPKPSTPKPISAAPTPAPATPATPKPTPSPKLEPGEIPKKAVNATTTASTSADGPVSVFSRSTGSLLPVSKWPMLSKLGQWLDSHPDANVHSSSVTIAQMVVGLTHPDRLGGDAIASINSSRAASSITTDKTNAASTSSIAANSSSSAALAEAATKQQLEALQMQMIMQQTLLQQSLLGFNPYSLASTSNNTTSTKPEDLLNPLLMASLMTNPLAMQTLLMDPTTLAAMSLAGASTTSSSTGTSCKKSKAPPNSQS